MIRARFKTDSEDPRPVHWPINHPYWVSGYSAWGDYAIVVAYADDRAEILRLWPDATHIEAMEAEQYVFTDRFPKPEWMN